MMAETRSSLTSLPLTAALYSKSKPEFAETNVKMYSIAIKVLRFNEPHDTDDPSKGWP